RTSQDARHRPGAERLWRACADAGDLYRREYEGLYCVGCEQFYTPDELDDGRCPEHETAPELVREENWFFRLSRYQQPLLDLLASGRLAIEPAVRANEVRSFIAGGLEDFSISRSVERTHGWGVPVPGDPTQVMYVWWDALGNYITSLDYGSGGADADAFRSWWQHSDQRVHVIGKGILRFHAVYWPAMLLSAGLPLPTHVFVHDYLTANGRRLSKSLGNVVDPAAVAGDHGADALRWWLLARVPKVGDTDFTVQRLVDAANRDLAGGIGNLAQRVVSMVHRYREGVVPDPGDGSVRSDPGAVGLRDACAALPVRIDAAVAGFDLRAATAAISSVVGAANRYVEDVAPWVLAKAERAGDADAARRLDVALAVLVDTVRVLGHELEPFVPEVARRLAFHGGSDTDDGKLPPPEPVFPRLEVTSLATA
ncbi:MAG TPA: methionine--tRNA ligase, partial [Actinopolymorphaceae bacterium]|nr:methionine--tRNA ligase [Actinopolymorphaceae bacterium]